MFDDAKNVPIWYPLSSGSRPGQKAVNGDLLVKIGLVGEIDQSVLDAIEEVMGGAYYGTLFRVSLLRIYSCCHDKPTCLCLQ